MKKMLVNLFVVILVLYFVMCGLLYIYQEKLIFFPEKLNADFEFQFYQHYEEVNVKTGDGVVLNSVLFKAKDSKGVIFYLHGNAGSVDSWGEVANIYTNLNYDVFMPDYRGFGKSGGQIKSEKQLIADMQTAYDYLKTRYNESKIIILGYSIGTGIAAQIAASNHPRMLILQAPFYSMTDLVKRLYPFIPTFILKYPFPTNKYILECTMPIVIFHGKQDEIIYYGSSVKLKALLKLTDKLITLEGVGHNGMSSDPFYLLELEKIL